MRKDIQLMDKTNARQKLGLIEDKPVVAVLGGSQGSRPLNQHFSKFHTDYSAKGIQVLWQCGYRDYPALNEIKNKDHLKIFPFSDDMGAVYSAADIVISRAGALAISEMAIMGKTMILVPFPHAAGDHQLKNAQSFADKGAAKIVLQSNLEPGDLEKTIWQLFDNPEKLATIESKASSLSTPDALENIITVIMEVAQS